MSTDTIQGFRLSPHQKRLWFLQQDSSAYLTQGAILIQGNLQPDNLKAALQQVVNRHEILRTNLCRLANIKTPVMVVADSSSPLWEDIDLTNFPEQEQLSTIESLFQEVRHQGFEFEQGSVLRLSLLKLSQNSHILLASLPALCADVQTIKNLVHEISHSYSLCLDGKKVCNEVVQYLQFSEWQNQLLADEEAKTANEYWCQQKLSSLATFKLPFEYKSLKRAGLEINSFQLAIAPELTAQIETLAHKYETSTRIVLLACWQTLIWRLIGQPEIIIGMGCDRREYEELHEILGLLATWIPIKSYLTPDLCFHEVLEIVEKTLNEAVEWQDYFVPEPVENDNNLAFPIGFEFKQLPDECLNAGVSFTLVKYYSCIEPFKVKLTCTQYKNTLKAEVYYDVNYFSIDTIQKLAKQFQILLTNATANPDEKISKLEILSDSDRQKLLVDFNRTQVDYPQNKCIHQIFEAQVEKTPNNIAVVYEHQQLTYAELNRKANQLAHYLQTLGVKPEVVVGLCVERSLEMIIGLLGILKTGGAYLPLDPTIPKEGLAFRLQNTQASVLLTQQKLVHVLPTHPTKIVCLDTDWNAIEQHSNGNPTTEVTSANLAYVMFTSGTQGKPKAVAIEHQQLSNYLNAIADRLNLTATANFATVSTLAADLGNTVIFPSLCLGGCLHIISSECATDSAALAQYCHKHPIDCLKIVPSHLASLLASASSETILPRKQLILGGEPVSWDLINILQQQAPDCLIFNHYGPTEATVGVTTFLIENKQANYDSNTVPLGRPLANTQIYLLDEQLQPVPIGVTGELYIGGISLARGYLNRPELTAERFIPNPFKRSRGAGELLSRGEQSNDSDRLYKTGDLARYLPDGNIEFIGRLDHQVKIRGFRIELEEIEFLLCQHPQVQQAVVSVQEDKLGDKRLAAYVVFTQKKALNISDLRRFLREKLPEYMVPSAFVILNALPLTSNGKVNRSILPEPDNHRPELEAIYEPPQTETGQTIATIWQEMLNVEKVGINDNFFELGGDSLLLVQIHSKLKKVFHRDFSITDLFEHPTINSLVKYLNQEQKEQCSFEKSQNRAESRIASRNLR